MPHDINIRFLYLKGSVPYAYYGLVENTHISEPNSVRYGPVPSSDAVVCFIPALHPKVCMPTGGLLPQPGKRV